MPANNSPIYSRLADIQWVTKVSTANNTSDITTGTTYTVFTADATNGGYVSRIVVKADPANSTAATVFRFWINNGSAVGTASNSALMGELGLPATTTSATAPLPDFVFPVNSAIPAGYKIIATIGTAPGANAAFTVTCFGGKY